MKLVAFAVLLLGAVTMTGCSGDEDSGEDSAVNSAE
jgi:hypothetical protein